MTDSISRETALRTIEALKEISFALWEIEQRVMAIAEKWGKELRDLPSVQPEIIQCKDCKYRDADDFCTGRGYPNVLVPNDGFCDKGKRSEE